MVVEENGGRSNEHMFVLSDFGRCMQGGDWEGGQIIVGQKFRTQSVCSLVSEYCIEVVEYAQNLYCRSFASQLLQCELFICVSQSEYQLHILYQLLVLTTQIFVEFSHSCLHRALLSLCVVWIARRSGVAAVLQSPAWPMTSKRGPSFPAQPWSHFGS